MTKKKVLGIQIVYTQEKKLPKRRDTYPLKADFYLQEGIPSKNFISNQRIIDAITAYRKFFASTFKLGSCMGGFILHFDPKKKEATWFFYHPFLVSLPGFFKKKAIARELELRVSEEMKIRHPTLKGFIHLDPSKERIEQMERLGIKIVRKNKNGTNTPVPYPYKEAIAKLKAEIGRKQTNGKRKKKQKPVYRRRH